MFSSAKKRGLLRVALLIIVAVLGVIVWSYLSSSKQGAANYLFTSAKHADIERTIVSTGQLEPKRYVLVGAQVSGQVEDIAVEEGDVVSQGDLLVGIDATVFETQVQNTEAALESMKAQLVELRAQKELAQIRAKRNQSLYEQDAVSADVAVSSRIDVEVLDAKITARIAQIRADEASLAGDKATLGFTKVYAPISGTIASIAVRKGQTLNANQSAPELLQISDLTVMTLRAEVSEADVGDIYRGMPVYFSTLGNTTQYYHSNVRQVLPTPTEVNDVVLYQVLIDVGNPDGRLMDSMSTQVFFVQDKKENALIVPLAAVKGPTEAPFVLVSNAGNVERRPVKTGIRNRTEVEIVSGLHKGDDVVTGFQSEKSGQGGGMRGPGMPRGPRGSI